ncbi:MAG: type I methionyl aminopeptidase [Patescibacteria group bacterium]
MVTIKKPEEIEVLRQGGKILAEILAELVEMAKAGVKTIDLDRKAEELIIKRGGSPAFKNYSGEQLDEIPFPSTICASINDQLVHTPAGQERLKSGDIFSIDIGMKYPAADGYFTDMATTVAIGNVRAATKKLLKVTKQSLMLGIDQVKAGKKISDISKAVQKHVEANGFSVVRQLVGHGVGYKVHEDPRIPNYYDPRMKDVTLEAGMVLAIEPMVNVGSPAIRTLADGWTVATADGELCAHFEHTVVVTKSGCEILTNI